MRGSAARDSGSATGAGAGTEGAATAGVSASPRSRRHQSRKVSAGGAGRSRVSVQPDSGQGSRVTRPPRASGRTSRAPRWAASNARREAKAR